MSKLVYFYNGHRFEARRGFWGDEHLFFDGVEISSQRSFGGGMHLAVVQEDGKPTQYEVKFDGSGRISITRNGELLLKVGGRDTVLPVAAGRTMVPIRRTAVFELTLAYNGHRLEARREAGREQVSFDGMEASSHKSMRAGTHLFVVQEDGAPVQYEFEFKGQRQCTVKRAGTLLLETTE